jgi:hypothetical protein
MLLHVTGALSAHNQDTKTWISDGLYYWYSLPNSEHTMTKALDMKAIQSGYVRTWC